MTTIKARLRGDDRTGHFTDECIENLVGQDLVICASHDWGTPRGKAIVITGRRDVTDALVDIEITRVGPDGLPDGLPTGEDYMIVECGFQVVQSGGRATHGTSGLWLREIRLREISPAVAVIPAFPAQAPS